MQANEMKFSFQLKFDSLFEFSAPAYDDRHISYLLTEAQFRVFLTRYNPLANKYQKGFEQDEQRRRDLEQLIRSVRIDNLEASWFVSASGTINTNILTIGSTVGMAPGIKIEGVGIAANTVITSIIKEGESDDNPGEIQISKVLTSTISEESIEVFGLGKSKYQGGVHPDGVFLDLPEGFLYAVEEGVKLSGISKEAWVKPVRHDEYLANINNPYKQPYKNLVWRMDFSREINSTGTANSTNKRTELILPTGYELDYYRVRYLSMPPAIVCDEFEPTNQIHCILDESLHREIVDEAVAIAKAAVKPEEYQIGLSEKTRSE